MASVPVEERVDVSNIYFTYKNSLQKDIHLVGEILVGVLGNHNFSKKQIDDVINRVDEILADNDKMPIADAPCIRPIQDHHK